MCLRERTCLSIKPGEHNPTLWTGTEELTLKDIKTSGGLHRRTHARIGALIFPVKLQHDDGFRAESQRTSNVCACVSGGEAGRATARLLRSWRKARAPISSGLLCLPLAIGAV